MRPIRWYGRMLGYDSPLGNVGAVLLMVSTMLIAGGVATPVLIWLLKAPLTWWWHWWLG